MSIEEYKNEVKRIKGVISDLENQLARQKTNLQKQFLEYKNIWHERTVREAINIKAKEGFDVIRFPTPRTVALIEGFVSGENGNVMPYDIISAGDHDHLEPGDKIDYGGESFTVVEAPPYTNTITVAPSDKVNNFLHSQAMDKDIQARWDDVVYSFNNLEKEWGTIDTPEKAQAVIDGTDVVDRLIKFNNKEKDAKERQDYYDKNRANNPPGASQTMDAELERVKAQIEEIKARKKPSSEELKSVPKSVVEANQNNAWGYSHDYGVDYVLEEIAADESAEIIDDVEQTFKNNEYDNYEPDYEGIYGEGHVFYEDVGNDQRVWVVQNDAHVEELQQPDQYDEASSIEDFDITNFGGNQRTVLEFYNKQLIPYVQKLRKGNIELITDEKNNQWWETKVTKDDLKPPTAFRLKDDLARVGIKITNEQEQEILKLNKKIFGDQNVKIVGQILANRKALGSYSDKIIKILDKQANPEETFYHEAVHKYLDVFTEKNEYIKILQEGARQYGISDISQVEERIAEDFIDYVNRRKTFSGKMKAYFDRILRRIKKYIGKREVINELFDDILSGKAKKVNRAGQNVSLVASSVERKAIAQGLTRGFKDLAGYDAITIKEQSELASDLLKDLRATRAVLTGEKPLPGRLRGGAVITAVEEYIKKTGDAQMAFDLANSPLVSETSSAAQELRLLAEREPDSLARQMLDLKKARAEALKKRTGKARSEAVKEEVTKIKKSIKKVDKYDWNRFLETIKC